jgi:hypothetical protein
MSLFVYDGSSGTHAWSDLLGGGRFTNLERQGDALVGGEPTAGDVIVCHRVESPAVARRLQELAACGVVVVEIGTDGAAETTPQGNYYRRARGVGMTDPHFKACFAHFTHVFSSTGKPDWQLLEGPPPPDALLAYHLLGLRRDDEEASTRRQALRVEALQEARTIAAVGDMSFEEADIDDPAKVRDLLKGC